MRNLHTSCEKGLNKQFDTNLRSPKGMSAGCKE